MKFILQILFIAIAILVFIFGVNPIYSEVSGLKADIATYNEALDNSTNLQKTEDSLIKAYNEISQSDKDRLNSFLPDSINNIQFILELERIANLHNMPIKDIKFEAKSSSNASANPNVVVSAISTDTRPYGVFPIEFTTEGDYASFVLFLKDLEYNLRIADIKSISFNIPDANAKPVAGFDPNVYRYLIKVETYWLK